MALEPAGPSTELTIVQHISSPEALTDLLRFGSLWDFVLRTSGQLYMGWKHWLLAGPGPGGVDALGPGGGEGGGEGLAAREIRFTEGVDGLAAEFDLQSGTYGTSFGGDFNRQWYPPGPEMPMRAALVIQAAPPHRRHERDVQVGSLPRSLGRADQLSLDARCPASSPPRKRGRKSIDGPPKV